MATGSPNGTKKLTGIDGLDHILRGGFPAGCVYLKGWWPDVLLSDIEMPGQDGYALMEKVRGLSAQHESLPAVAVTAHSRPEDRARALEAGRAVTGGGDIGIADRTPRAAGRVAFRQGK